MSRADVSTLDVPRALVLLMAALFLGCGFGSTVDVRWYDPRAGGALQTGSVSSVSGGGPAFLGNPPSDPAEDWMIPVAVHQAFPSDGGLCYDSRFPTSEAESTACPAQP